jgi:hypothetical protein
MGKVIRIGSASGSFIDSTIGAPQLIKNGDVQYLMLDYMAELTTSIFSKAMKENPEFGFALEFTDWIWKDNVRDIAKHKIKLVTNAGGLNPHGCRRRMERFAVDHGVSLKIAVVEGDNVMDHIPELASHGITEMYTNKPLPPISKITSANAYLGARPIAVALAQGADIVITGRVADSALVLGPLMYEFGWDDKDYDFLAAGSLAGHIIECSAQATGGLFTDWRQVANWAHIGYPVIECTADGSFVVTKPKDTGGIVTVGTIAEQMLYEIGDPQTYFLPDVTCDFSHVCIEQLEKDRVRVSGAKGLAPTSTYKVCATFQDGYRAIGILPIVGMEAAAKAECQAAAIMERIKEILRERNLSPYRTEHVEILGTEATYGAHSRIRDTREVISKITVEHEDRTALDIFMREVRAPIISMIVGNTGWFPGQPAIAPIVRLFSFLMSKAELQVSCDMDGIRWNVPITIEGGFNQTQVVRLEVPQVTSSNEERIEVPLIDLAWARSGDKGDSFNVGVIAREPEYLPYIWTALTETAVQEFFVHEFTGAVHPRVERFIVPGISAINFLCHEGLGGGGAGSPRLDALGKGKAQQLLEFKVSIPRSLVRKSDNT